MALDLRPSAIAGTWYEGDPKALAREVDGYIESAHLPPLEGEVLGVIAPHAGYYYSGPVAGYAFAAVRGASPDLVAVLSPYHQYHHAPLLTAEHDGYSTPLGTVPISKSALGDLENRLSALEGPSISRISNDQEHSLEIELPFLQRALTSKWELLPVMVSTHDAPTCRILGRALADVLKDRRGLSGRQHGPLALQRTASGADAGSHIAGPGRVLRDGDAFRPGTQRSRFRVRTWCAGRRDVGCAGLGREQDRDPAPRNLRRYAR